MKKEENVMAVKLTKKPKPYPKEVESRKCLGMVRMLEVLKKLNPTGRFSTLGENDILVVGLYPWEIKCPKGYSITEENLLTNKNKPGSGWYDAFQLV